MDKLCRIGTNIWHTRRLHFPDVAVREVLPMELNGLREVGKTKKGSREVQDGGRLHHQQLVQMRKLREEISDPLIFDLFIRIDQAPTVCPRAHDDYVSQPCLTGVGAAGPQLDDRGGVRAHPQPLFDCRVAQSIPWSPKAAMKRILHTLTAMVQIMAKRPIV